MGNRHNPLPQGVKWHDGKPFTAADVKCTFDLLMGKAKEKLRIDPRNKTPTGWRRSSIRMLLRRGSSAPRHKISRR